MVVGDGSRWVTVDAAGEAKRWCVLNVALRRGSSRSGLEVAGSGAGDRDFEVALTLEGVCCVGWDWRFSGNVMGWSGLELHGVVRGAFLAGQDVCF